jgi:methylated-DNA-[protein]-cysteine S-methyltransferase
MSEIYIGHTDMTPIGELWVAVGENGLLAVEYPATQDEFIIWLQKHHHNAKVEFSAEKVHEALTQLCEYIAGERREFDLPIDWSVLNEFQQKVLKITYAIPCGETRTYKEIAIEIGNPNAARAVGRAQAINPMPIVIPCHRVVGSDNKMHGYGGGEGIPTKVWLLEHEKAIIG